MHGGEHTGYQSQHEQLVILVARAAMSLFRLNAGYYHMTPENPHCPHPELGGYFQVPGCRVDHKVVSDDDVCSRLFSLVIVSQ